MTLQSSSSLNSTNGSGSKMMPMLGSIPSGGISYNSSTTVSSPLAISRTPSTASTATTSSMRSHQGYTNNSLPPKSPASSLTARRLLSVTSSASSSSGKSRGSRRGRSRSKSRSGHSSKGRRSSSRSSKKSLDSNDASSDTESDKLLPKAPPNSGSVSVETDSDDLSSAEDFSNISFDTKSNSSGSNNSGNGSPTSVLIKGADPLTGLSDGLHHHERGRSHHRMHSWDSLPAGQGENSSPDAVTDGAAGTKTCLAVPKILQRNRKQRVMVADVASVGNASDTLVPAENGRITGRELHEAAKALLNDGDYEQALHMFEAILNAQIERFGSEEHSSVGAALHNVGVVRLRMGDHLIAEDVLLHAAAIRRSVLGADHLDVAATLTKLGSARTALHKFDQGLQELRDALNITRKALGRNHRTAAQILCHIACLYFEAEEYFSAQATFEDALDIYRSVFQVDTDRDACMAQMTETLCNIGSIQNKRKNFTGAIESFREALDLQRGIMGHDHPRVIASLDNLGYSFSKSKSYNQALICYKEMLTAQISHHGSFTLECCDTLKKQVLILQKLKDTDGAALVVSTNLEDAKAKDADLGDPVVLELEQMLADLKSAKRYSKSKPKNKTKKAQPDRALDCFDRILFDKRRAEF